jgi:excisionase family DNA binding protein
MTDQTPDMSSGGDSEQADTSPVSIREAVDIAGVTEKTIRRWIHNGRLIAHKVGGQYAIDPAALDLARLDAQPPSRLETGQRNVHPLPRVPLSGYQTGEMLDSPGSATSSTSHRSRI